MAVEAVERFDQEFDSPWGRSTGTDHKALTRTYALFDSPNELAAGTGWSVTDIVDRDEGIYVAVLQAH